MNKSLILALLTTLCATVYAQQPQSERKELTDKIFASYQKGNLEAASEAGEKLVKLESSAKDSVSYVNALVNLARIRRAYFVALTNKLIIGRPNFSEANQIREKAGKNADDAESLFREALEINEKTGKGQTAQAADIKKDLAWLMSNHSYTGKKTVDKSRSRIDDAEKILLEAIFISEQTRGKDADETLSIVLDAGDFYYKYANLEKASSFYERFIQTYDRKNGTNPPNLLNALRPYANILFATFREPESTAVVNRIEAITKEKEPKLTSGIDLHLRSKDAVSYSAPIIAETNDKAEDYRNRLKAEGKVLNARNASLMPRTKIVPVEVEVDETGKISKATAKTDNDKLKTEAENAVSTWTVRPFSFNGTTRKIRGTLNYRKPN